MAGPNLAHFDFDDDGADDGFVADPGDTVSITIRNPNVRNWQAQVWDSNAYVSGNPILDNPPPKSKNAPDVDLVGATTGRIVAPTTPAAAVTITLPNTGNGINSYMVRVLVDGGMTRGVVDPSKIHHRLIATAPSNLRKPVLTERSEFELSSWSGPVCDLIDAYHTLIGGGGSFTAAGSRQAVRVATAAALPAYTRTGNILTANANGALPSIDGVSLSVGERLLLVDGAGPSSAAHAGIYVVTSLGGAGSAWVLTRASDMDSNSEAEPGVHFWVLEGTANGGSLAVLIAPSSGITLNTTNLDFALFELSGGGGGGGSLPAAVKGDTYVFDGTDVDTVPIGTAGQVYGVPYGQGSGGMPNYFTPDFNEIFPGAKAGDTVQWNGSAWVFISIGSKGQIPVVNDDGEIEFEDPPLGLPLLGQEGDLTIFKGGGWTRLPIGPSGSVVGSVGGYPTYMLIASGSGGGSGSFFPIGAKNTLLRSNGSEWEVFGPGDPGEFVGADNDGVPDFRSLPESPTGPIRLPVRTASLVNVASLAGEQVVSGVDLEEDDRVLLPAQDDPVENGIYVVEAGAWTRAEDFDLAAEMGRGILIGVLEGTGVRDSYWLHTTAADPIVVETTGLSFQRVTLPEPVETGSIPVNVGKNQFDWRTGNNGTFLGMVNGEPVFVELPPSTGTGGGNTPEAVANSRASWQSVVVDAAILFTDLPANSTTSIAINALANGALPTIDGVALLVGSTILVFGLDPMVGIYRVSDLGSSTSPWRLTRVNFSTVSAEMVIRSNRTVSVRRGNSYREREFLHLTGSAPGDLTVPGGETIDVGVDPIHYALNGADAPEADAALPVVVYADFAARNLSGFTVQSGETIVATQDGSLSFDDGIPTSAGVGDRILVYGTTSIPARNGVYRVDSVGGTTTSPRWRMTRVPEMDTAEKLLGCKIVTVLSGNGFGSDHRGTDFFNYTDPDSPFVLNTTVPTFGQEVEEQSQLIWTDITIDNSAIVASTPSDNFRIITANSNGTFPTVDGVAPASVRRVLISGSSPRCGVYSLNDIGSPTAPWVMIRIPDLVTQRQMERCKAVVQRMGSTGAGSVWVRTAPGEFQVVQVGVTSTSWASAASIGGSRLVQVRLASLFDGIPSNNRVGSNRTATANGALTVDAVLAASGDKVLLFGADVGAGVWVVTNPGNASTPWTMTRAPEMDSSAEVQDNAVVSVMLGSNYGGKLFVRANPLVVTLNTSVLEYYLATPDQSIDQARDHGNPTCFDTTDGIWKPFHGSFGTQSAFPALVLKNIRSSTSERGIVVEQLSDGLPARALFDRRRVTAGELVGSIAEIIGRTWLDSTVITDGYSETHSVVMDSGAPSVALAGPIYDRVSSIAVKLAGWTANARDTLISGNAMRIFPGALFAERPESSPVIGHETSVGFMKNANVLGRIFSRVVSLTGTAVRTVDLGVDTLWESEIIKSGNFLTDRMDTTNATTTAFNRRISVAAGQLIELDYTIVGIRSDSNAHAIARGALVANRLATGNVLQLSHDPYPILRSTNAAAWGDEAQTRAKVNSAGTQIEFEVVGLASTNIRWQLRCGWTIYTQNGVGA